MVDPNLPLMGDKRQRIVILGAGFAGLKVAKLLSKNSDFQVLILDRNNYHQFQPLLYQVATAGLEPSSISFPVRRVFQKRVGVFIRVAEVQEIDTKAKRIFTNKGEYSYDKLIVALGTVTNFFGNRDIERYAIGLKSVSEALYIRNQILKNYENALVLKGQHDQEASLNIAIVGGGPTGVELAGAMAELRNAILPKEYPELDFTKMNIYLIEAFDRLLGTMSHISSIRANRYLEKLGVKVLLNTRVEAYNGKEVTTTSGKILSFNVIWAAGMRGITLSGIPEKSILSGGRIAVDSFHQIDGVEDVYAIGDISLMETINYPHGHPQVAPVAIQQAENLAKNLIREHRGKSSKPFKYIDKGTLATVGRNLAVADFPFFSFGGFTAWFIWMAVHLMSILGIKNRFFIFINWLTNYFSYNLSLRLIIKAGKPNHKGEVVA